MYLNMEMIDSGKKLNFSLESEKITIYDVMDSLKSFGIEITYISSYGKYFFIRENERYEMNVPFDNMLIIKLDAKEFMKEVYDILVDSEVENFSYTLE